MNQINNTYSEKIDNLNKNFSKIIYNWSKDIENNMYRDKIINLFNTIDVLNEELLKNQNRENYSDKDILDTLIPIIYGFKFN